MEYLVTMTTHVPDGTPEQAVDDARAREAAHSRDLATEGQLLRLWRPPLQPGEWRSLGLFAAGDAGQLQQTLAAMPLKIWRTDQVTTLAPHPNDQGLSTRPGQSGAEFLAIFVVTIPDGTPAMPWKTPRRARPHARELADQGHLERLWALPGQGCALSLYRAGDSPEMEAIVKALPLDPWMTTELTPLTPHPSDPATMST
jgi:muconolactone delta-isomerase